ncbi:lysylphosphatidylglycerol synthase transmembrane domain-containing protein [Methylocapsa acidiphila]|uniref:lysylphosphatidylglycerol synthase transmembrane domain-containing protein n=1 Tax=Methylocapsa acidiphila TaxID=133552 RepID=UPI0003FCD816|nr:YbhN family protein [Methylocapsa acidiphila]
MKRVLDFVWPVLGLVAVVISVWLLYREFRGQSVGPEVWEHVKSISPAHYFFAILSTLVAYAALAWYDRIALLHLGVKHISWIFISLCSFTTYALAHNIGATVFSGGVVRYRAYSTKGLNAEQVALLVAICSLTFFLGVILLGGLISVFEPEQLARFSGLMSGLELGWVGGKLRDILQYATDAAAARTIGVVFLSLIAIYVAGSVFKFKPLVIRGFVLEYPHPEIVLRQLIAAPLELLGAAGIIYFALPEVGNPGYFVVLGVFLASFSAALASNAPGGLGVLELFFINAMPATPKVEVLAALLVFRLFYLLIPLLISIVIVILFERSKLEEVLHHEEHPPLGQGALAGPDAEKKDDQKRISSF